MQAGPQIFAPDSSEDIYGYNPEKGAGDKNLYEEKNRLFGAIENLQYKIERRDLVELVRQIFEHSTDDGILISKQLRLTGHEVAQVIGRAQFYFKHPEVAFAIKEKAQSKMSEMKTKNADEVLDVLSVFDKTQEKLDDYESALLEYEKIRFITPDVKPQDMQAKSILRDINTYYSNLIQSREFEIDPGPADSRSKGERVGEMFIERNANAIKRKDQRLDVVFHIERQVAQKHLEKELRGTLSRWEVELIYDPINKKYDVVFPDQGPDASGSFKSEHIDVGEYLHVGAAERIDGEIVFSARKSDGRYIVTPTKEYGPYEDVWSHAIKINEKIAFKAQKTDGWYIITPAKEYGPYEHVWRPQEEGGGTAFKVKKTDGEYIVTPTKEYGPYEGCDLPRETSGNVTFRAVKTDGTYIVTQGEESGPYDRVTRLYGKDDGFLVDNLDGTSSVIISNKKYGPYGKRIGRLAGGAAVMGGVDNESDQYVVTPNGEYGPYWDIQNAGGINGEFVVGVIKKKGDSDMYVVTPSKEYGPYKGEKRFDTIEKISSVGGELAIAVGAGAGDHRRSKIFFADKEYGPYDIKYESEMLQEIYDVDNEMVLKFGPRHGQGSQRIITPTNEYGPYLELSDVQNIGGEMIYSASEESSPGEEFVFTPNKKYGPYTKVSKIFEHAGQFVAEVEKGDVGYVITPDKEYGPYVRILQTSEIANELVITTETADDKVVLVTPRGETEPFDSVYETCEENGVGWVLGRRGDVIVREPISNPPKTEGDLSERERRKLDLLNLVVTDEHNIDEIDGYFLQYHPDDVKTDASVKFRDSFSKLKGFVKLAGELARNAPAELLRTMSASKDALPNMQAQKILKMIAPEIYERKSSQSWSEHMKNFFGGGTSTNPFERRGTPPSPQDYLKNRPEHSLAGGNPRGQEGGGSNPEIMRMRDPLYGMIASSITGSYDKKSSRWRETDFAVDREFSEAKETTITLPSVKGLREVVLPMPIDGRLISGRVKGIKDGQEVALSVETNALGKSVATTQGNLDAIIYSLAVPTAPRLIPEMGDKEYASYRTRFVRKNSSSSTSEHEHDLLSPLGTLPVEMEQFVQSIEQKTPKQRMIAIEQYVRDVMYYDFDNGEVSSLKGGRPFDEQLAIMKERMESLKDGDPSLAEKTKRKYFAGVCADAALLTTALLRRAGLLSGTVVGFSASGTSITVENAHGASFVVLPNDRGGNELFIVDGTPGGVDVAQQDRLNREGIASPTIEEREDEMGKELERLQNKARDDFDKLMEDMGELTPKKIQGLANGRLESVLNNMLRYDVQAEHAVGIQRLLESYWYTPLSQNDISTLEGKIDVMRFFEDEIKNAKDDLDMLREVNPVAAGTYLLKTVEDFVARMGGHLGKEKTFQVLQGLSDAMGGSFSETEKRAFSAIVAYLSAERMTGRR